MNEHETNTGWWTEKPDREERPSSYAQLGGSPSGRSRAERVWLTGALIIALMVALGWAILRLASA
ncbi:hypothetical protein J7E62_14265 [Variovorax paradoxus]|nr:hypothetical protein [Variovorax paradoxus]